MATSPTLVWVTFWNAVNLRPSLSGRFQLDCTTVRWGNDYEISPVCQPFSEPGQHSASRPSSSASDGVSTVGSLKCVARTQGLHAHDPRHKFCFRRGGAVERFAAENNVRY